MLRLRRTLFIHHSPHAMILRFITSLLVCSIAVADDWKHEELRSWHSTRAPLMKIVLSLVALASCAVAADAPPAVAPLYYSIRYEASDKPGELAMPVTYTIWIPEDVKTLRGVIVHQHGCGKGAGIVGQTAAYDLHWQALARK